MCGVDVNGPIQEMIHFIRHGQTDANLQRVLAGGEHDIPLNATGIRQAEAFGAANQSFIKNVDTVYVSPMIRARQTADLVIQGHKKPVEVIENLREWILGDWSGLAYDALPDILSTRPDPPGGEPWNKFQNRCLKAIRQLAENKEKILIVAHGGVWNAYAHKIRHHVIDIENCTMQEICRIKLGTIPLGEQA